METLSYETWSGRTAYDQHGEKIGKITNIFYDDVSGRPEWAEVKAGLFKGTRLVPLARARVETEVTDDDEDEHDERLVLAFPLWQINAAIDVDTDDDHLDPAQERELYQYYGFDWNDRTAGNFGYGSAWSEPRFDADYDRSKFGAIGNVDTTVRLRRYQAQR
jgi:hypothetical protein